MPSNGAYPGVDPDGKQPGGLEIAGNVEAGSVSILGDTITPGLGAVAYFTYGTSGTLADGAEIIPPIQSTYGNIESASTLTLDAAAFSGKGGVKLLKAGTYLLRSLITVAAGGSGPVEIVLESTPFNGFSDISTGGYLFNTNGPFTNVLPILYFTGTDLPLDTITFKVHNASGADGEAIINSLQVIYLGGN